MLRMVLINLLLCFFTSFSLPAKIIDASNLKQVKHLFKNLNSDSLVMWDVDSTLIAPTDHILLPGNERACIEISKTYLSGQQQEQWSILNSQILSRTSYCLVESELVSFISSLQKKAIPTMAFTAMQTGSFGLIDSMEKWRADQLLKLRIDFSSFLPQHKKNKWQGTPISNRSPSFYRGILCTDHLPKGPVIKMFFKEMGLKPAKVIFIDDNLSFLKSVKEALLELNIPFIGIHYLAAKQLNVPVNLERAHYQFRTLVERGVWLTDLEAQLEYEGVETSF